MCEVPSVHRGASSPAASRTLAGACDTCSRGAPRHLQHVRGAQCPPKFLVKSLRPGT